jgi:hypothetical protein
LIEHALLSFSLLISGGTLDPLVITFHRFDCIILKLGREQRGKENTTRYQGLFGVSMFFTPNWPTTSPTPIKITTQMDIHPIQFHTPGKVIQPASHQNEMHVKKTTLFHVC